MAGTTRTGSVTTMTTEVEAAQLVAKLRRMDGVSATQHMMALITSGKKPRSNRVKELEVMLEKVIRFAENQLCLHEETHRGGTIWTICNMCGQKWADDEGGFKPYEEPAILTEARNLLENK